jgi:carbon monoxide dehydrogenase subunit G
MSKIPAEIERSVTVRAPLPRVYAFLWDVVGASTDCTPGLASCRAVGPDTYEFVYKGRTIGPVTLAARYTVRYEGNGTDRISFESIGAADDNADARGVFSLAASGPDATRIAFRQELAPDVPIPRLLHGMARGFVEKEVSHGVEGFLDGAKRALEAS